MALYAQPVIDFVTDCYQIISASSPTVPLHGNDVQMGVRFLNELLKHFSSTGLLITIAKKVNFTLNIGQQFVTFADATYTPAADVQVGRLANLQNAWLELDGVDYPLIDESRNVFFGSYKYEPQQGLPRYIIITNDLNLTTMQFYPSASQQYNVFVYGKFELSYIHEEGTMESLPLYYYRFFKLAVARELSIYKGRSSAWTEKLEERYQEALDDMESASSINLVIDSPNESFLNGSWRVRAGI